MKKIYSRLFLTIVVSVFFFSANAQKLSGVINRVMDDNGNPKLIELSQASTAYNLTQAEEVLSQYLGTTQHDKFQQKSFNEDNIGMTHKKYQQFYKGIPVEYGTYTVHATNGKIVSMNGEFKKINDINVSPSISEESALANALNHVNAEVYMWDIDGDKFYPNGEIVIVENYNATKKEDVGKMRLAYKFNIYAAQPLSRAYVYVDAQNGEILHENAIIKSAAATGSADTRYSGTKSISTDSYNGYYRLRDVVRGNGIITYNCNESTNYSSAVDFTDNDNNWTAAEYNNADKDNGALDAHWAGMVTYDYFNEVHGRNSFDGNGAQIKTYVHFDNNYENAYWNGSVFTFGDGASTFDILTSLDVFGHEFGHAVCSYTCDLTYSKEPGALNEAFSDIWGCAIEYKYAPDKDTWLMGEDIGYVLRSLSDPKSKGLPDTYLGDNWVTSSADYYGVHTNNGPFCYWFYLISVGGSGTNDNGDSYDVTGIGIDKAEQIAYRVESVYMSASSDYEDARTYAIQAAKDLYGAGSQAEISVTNAMYAIGVGSAYGDNTVSYCASKGSNFSYEWIAGVTVGDYTKTSGAAGYTNYTSEIIDLNAGSSYNVSLVPGFASTTYNEYWKIWIDYNGDADFDDANELVFDAGALSKTTVTGSFTVPTGIAIQTRMRVSMKYDGAQTACETFSYGEVEDYTVNITSGGTDTQAPTAPGNLAASNVTQTTVDLSWNASSDNVGVTAYMVYQGTSLLGEVTGTTAQVTGLTANTSYSFSVKAKDAAGNVSSASNTVNVTTLQDVDTQAPTAPTSLAASSVGTTSLTLSWNASSDNVGVTGYDIYRNGNYLASTASTSYGVTGLSANTSYSFYVKAKDAAGNVSSNSNTVNVTTQSDVDTQAPTAPASLAASNVGQTSLTLGWNASSDNVGVTGYDIYRNGSYLASTTSTSYSVSGLTANTTYSFYVKAKDAAGNISSASSTINVTTLDDAITYCTSQGNNASYEWIAGVVIGSFNNTSGSAKYTDFTSMTVNVETGNTAVTLTPGFSGSTYNEYWKIWIDLNIDGDFDDAGELVFDAGAMSKSAVSGTMVIPTSAEGVTSRMRVSMKYNAAQTACETFSYGEVEDYTVTIAASVPDTEAPTAPTGLAASNIGQTSLTLSWNASSDNVAVTGYDVYRNGSFLASTTSTSYAVSGLSAATTYSFYVKAKDAAGNVSGASSTINATTLDQVISYCSSKGNNDTYEWIDLVQLGSMTNSTGKDGGYADYTNLVANAIVGSNTIYFSAGFRSSSYTEFWHVWIDFNHDGDFEDSGEQVVSGSSSSSSTLSATFTIPTSAMLGTTRMRVTMKYNSAATPCETFSYGEVEDYTINIGSSFGFAAANTNDLNAELLGNEVDEILVYPNPTTNELNVELNGFGDYVDVKVMNINGQVIFKQNADDRVMNFNVSELPAGIYLIAVDNGRIIETKRFVKQ